MSANGIRAGVLCFMLTGAATFVTPARAAHSVDQTVALQPGWNAVWLEVEPESNATVDVFHDLPIASAWTWLPRGTSAEFIEDLSEELVRRPEWLCFFPTNRPERMFNNLFRVQANRPYFIKLEGTNPVNWVVSGRPAIPAYNWSPNEYNLVGFPLRPGAALPSLDVFFSPDAALSGQPVYVLNASGRWEQASGAQALVYGACMWVLAGSGSTYPGPVEVTAGLADGLDYGKTLTERELQIRNVSGEDTVVRLRDAAGPGPITYWSFNPSLDQGEWLPLPDPLVIDLSGGATETVRISVNRDQFTGSSHETTLEVESDSGIRVRVPLSARLP